MEECVDEGFGEVSDKLDDLLINQLKEVSLCNCNCINGYFEHLDTFNNITMLMKDRGYTFSVRDSEIRKKRTTPAKELGSDKEHGPNTVFFEQKVMNIKFFGLPFTVDKTTHYQCTYGCKYYKSKAKSDQDSPMLLSKKRRSAVSKKIGCLARMTLKKVTVYPGYVLDVLKNWKKKKQVIKTLRNDLNNNPDQVLKTCRYYISISVQSSHNHPPSLKDTPSPKPKKKKSSEPPKKLVTKRERTDEGDWVTLYSDKDDAKALAGDATFFNSLVKFPSNTVAYTRVKPVTFEIRGFDVEQLTKQDTTAYQLEQTIEYSVQDLQISFKEKLKRLYTLSENCTNTALLLKLISDLEQVDDALISDIGYDPSL